MVEFKTKHKIALGVLVLTIALVSIIGYSNNETKKDVINDKIDSNENVTIKAYLNLDGCSPEITDLLEQLRGCQRITY